MGPCLGNLGAIARLLKPEKLRKLKWNVSFYSGEININGMHPSDLVTLVELSCGGFGGEESTIDLGKANPIVDVSKAAFFGYDDRHIWTTSFARFAEPNCAS